MFISKSDQGGQFCQLWPQGYLPHRLNFAGKSRLQTGKPRSKTPGRPRRIWWVHISHPIKRRICQFCRLKKAFSGFFWTKSIPAKRSTFAYSMSCKFGKFMFQRSIWVIWNQLKCILQGVRFLLANCTCISATSKTVSYKCKILLMVFSDAMQSFL